VEGRGKNEERIERRRKEKKGGRKAGWKEKRVGR
jgi:hypothetical protein